MGNVMNITSVVTQVYEKSVVPAICFEVKITYVKNREAIINLEGWLESDDGKILAQLVETSTRQAGSIGTESLSAKDSGFDQGYFTESVYDSTLVAFLDRKTIDYIERRRAQNQKRDIYFTLNLSITSILCNATVSHLHELAPQNLGLRPAVVTTSSGRQDQATLLGYAWDQGFRANRPNLWIISGENNPIFLSLNRQTLRKEGVRINAVDWIHDYSPKLELGEYFIVEIPKGKQVLKKAWSYLEKAEECYRQWDTKGAYANCREVRTVLNDAVKEHFKTDPAIKKWNRAIEKFEKLASLDLHGEDIKNEEPKGEVGVGRPEVEYLLIVTKALVKYAEELLQEKPSAA
jgi:hypothetical protein